MRIAATLLCATLTVSHAKADPLSAADREALLDSLEALRDSADELVDSRFRVAISAYRQAMDSNEAAIEFYLKCIEKVNYEDQQKKYTDFREWKRKQADHLSDPQFRLALRYQLRWLVLLLQASSEKADTAEIAKEARETLDAIFLDVDKLDTQGQILKQSVVSTVFAQAYEISNVDKSSIPTAPLQLTEFYSEVVFPPLRTPDRLEFLRAAWIKSIQQQAIEAEVWSGGGNGRGQKAGQDNTRALNAEKFASETLPQLQWDMEMDLFSNGDEAGAAKRMLAHIEKYITHKSARKWGEDFQKLLAPEIGPTPAASVE
jgi:hypothetical protein